LHPAIIDSQTIAGKPDEKAARKPSAETYKCIPPQPVSLAESEPWSNQNPSQALVTCRFLSVASPGMIAWNCLDCAASALSGETQLLNGMFLLDQEWKLGRLPQKNERSAGEILYGAFDKSPLLLGSSNPESQRRGADLSLSLLKLLPTDRQEKRVRRLLAIPLETSAERNLGSAEACRGTCLASTLVSAAPEIKTETLANDMAARLIEAAGEHDLVMTCRVFGGLTDLADLTRPEIRNRIV
jgi:hypothetical protein